MSDRNTSRLAASLAVLLSEARGVGNISRDDKSSLALIDVYKRQPFAVKE